MLGSEKKLLIVDDISTNRVLLKIMCEKLGYSCDVAGNGKDAMELFKNNKYDLIFLDCQMPIMDGYDVSREMRKIETSESTTPIIAITAYVFSENKEKCIAAGMNDFIGKPLKKHELQTVIERWLKKDNVNTDKIEENKKAEKNHTVEIESANTSKPKTENENIIKMFIESTAIKIVSFEKYLLAKDDKFCMITAVGLKNNFKLVNSDKLADISTELSRCCLEKDYKKCSEILKKLKSEFEVYAKENNFEVKC